MRQAWHFIGFGKHPVAGDYFRVGDFTTILTALTTWVEKGYEHLIKNINSQEKAVPTHNSWRFWIMGPQSDTLVVGVLKDSSDSHGRLFPFLMAGEGPLKKRESNWNLFPIILEKIWCQMENFGTQQFSDVKQVEKSLVQISPPDQDWYRLLKEGKPRYDFNVSTSQTQPQFKKIEQKIETVMNKPQFLLSMEMKTDDDALMVAGMWHDILKKKLHSYPHALFMGGVPEKTFIAAFLRPLSSANFYQIWSAHNGDSFDQQLSSAGIDQS